MTNRSQRIFNNLNDEALSGFDKVTGSISATWPSEGVCTKVLVGLWERPRTRRTGLNSDGGGLC